MHTPLVFWLIRVFMHQILESGYLIHMVKHRENLSGVELCEESSTNHQTDVGNHECQ
jgi:hypothetical protein